jgi:hypothetical protein
VVEPLDVLLFEFELFMFVPLEPGWLEVSLVEPVVGVLPLVDPLTPVDPLVPVDPVVPVEPLVPVDSVEPLVPRDPLVPAEPVVPVEPVVPADPLTPAEPLVPVDPLALPLVPVLWFALSRSRSRGELVSPVEERFWLELRPWRSRCAFVFAWSLSTSLLELDEVPLWSEVDALLSEVVAFLSGAAPL